MPLYTYHYIHTNNKVNEVILNYIHYNDIQKQTVFSHKNFLVVVNCNFHDILAGVFKKCLTPNDSYVNDIQNVPINLFILKSVG